MFTVFYRYLPGIFPGRQEAAVPLNNCSAFTKKHFRNTLQSSSPSLRLNLPLSGPGEGGLPARFPPKRKACQKWSESPSSLYRQCQDPLQGCAVQSTLQRTLKMQKKFCRHGSLQHDSGSLRLGAGQAAHMAVNEQVLELREGADRNFLPCQSQAWLQRMRIIPSVRWLQC